MAARARVPRHPWAGDDTFLQAPIDSVTALRELRAADGEALALLLQDPHIRRFMPGAPKTAHAVRRFARWSEQQRQRRRHLCLAVTHRDRPIGILQAWPLEPEAHTIEWGFALGQPYRGRGIFQRAARTFITLAVSDFGVERLEARTAVHNASGISALLRLGARPEGLLRECFRIDGARIDCLLWCILARDWQAGPETPRRPCTPPPPRLLWVP